MPDLSEAEIKAKIGDGTIFALSIDTAVFDKYGCHLDFAVLNKLDQFKRSVTALLFSEVVVNEIKNHIVRAAEDTQLELKKAIRQQGKRWKTEIDIGRLPPALALLAIPPTPPRLNLTITWQRLAAKWFLQVARLTYRESCCVDILPASHLSKTTTKKNTNFLMQSLFYPLKP
jgi:hypothetical protein